MTANPRHILQTIAAAVAVIFGVVTLFAGGSVLFSRDPGYVVYKPLLYYNVAMGFVYIWAGLLIWRSAQRGRGAAFTIFVLNLLVLIGIVVASRMGSDVASESFGAMTFRTVLWLVLYLAVVRASR